jgi:hypothetical protein
MAYEIKIPNEKFEKRYKNILITVERNKEHPEYINIYIKVPERNVEFYTFRPCYYIVKSLYKNTDTWYSDIASGIWNEANEKLIRFDLLLEEDVKEEIKNILKNYHIL